MNKFFLGAKREKRVKYSSFPIPQALEECLAHSRCLLHQGQAAFHPNERTMSSAVTTTHHIARGGEDTCRVALGFPRAQPQVDAGAQDLRESDCPESTWEWQPHWPRLRPGHGLVTQTRGQPDPSLSV
jgi:hypothetical protein